MNKKKILIIAILLFIGLGTFVFANPDEQLLEEDIDKTPAGNLSNTKNEYEENTYNSYKKDNINTTGQNLDTENNDINQTNNNEIINNNNQQSSSSGQTGNNTNNGVVIPPVDSNDNQNIPPNNNGNNNENNNNENTENKDDNTQTPPNVPDPPVETETPDELIRDLVLNLQQQVLNAKNKLDIIKAKEYREINQINQKLGEVLDINIKNELQTILNDINKILDDNQKPNINGILNGTYTNESVTLTIIEENIKIITLNGVEVTKDQLINIVQDGVYEIIVIDKAYNQESINFTIDKKAPEVIIETSNKNLPTNKNVTVSLKANEIIKEESGWILSKDKQTLSKTFENNGQDCIIIEDLAGNQTIVNYQVIGIDRIFNNAIVTTSNNGKPTNQDVIVTIIADEPLQPVSGWNLSLDKKSLSKAFAKNINSFITIKDLAGNSQVVSFQVINIDKEIPALVENGITYTIDANDNVVVTIRSKKPILTPEGWEIVENPFVFSKVYKEDKQEVVILRDIYANQGSVIINVNKKEIINNLNKPKKQIPKIIPSILNSLI